MLLRNKVGGFTSVTSRVRRKVECLRERSRKHCEVTDGAAQTTHGLSVLSALLHVCAVLFAGP